MKITQLKTILEGAVGTTGIIDQTTGTAPVANEDLSNIVDIGKVVLDYTGESNENYDSFMRNLIDQVGKIVIVNRAYTSQAPNIIKDSWEYGSIMQKVRVNLPDVEENATWDIFNYPKSGGAAYPDPFELSKPSVTAKFYNSKNTYEIPITLTDYQLREAFQSASQFGSFIAAIENRIRVKQTLCNDGLIMATIDNLIGETLSGHGGKVVNLLSLYNGASGTLTAAEALTNKEFLRFASATIAKYKKYVAQASAKYNAGNYITFTPADKLKFVANTEFAKALDAYLYSDTFNEEFVKLDGYSEVPFWQGSGTADGDRLTVDVVVSYTTDQGANATASVKNTGVLAVMFDDEAAAVCNENYRTTSIYNPRGEYTNYFYKYDAMFMNDVEENCIVFTIADNTQADGQ